MRQSKLGKFETFGDSCLRRMMVEGQRFIEEVEAKSEPRWLSYVGPSGTGKTLICEEIISRCGRLNYHPDLLKGIHAVHWTSFLRKLRGGEYRRLDDVAESNLCLIDDMGTSGDTTFALEQLYGLIELRNRKWTLITSNLTMDEIAERLDTRIASRLIRDRNVCVEVDAIDFALRKGKA